MRVNFFVAVGVRFGEDEKILLGVDSNRRLIEIKRDSFLHSNKDSQAWVTEHSIETEAQLPKDVKPEGKVVK